MLVRTHALSQHPSNKEDPFAAFVWENSLAVAKLPLIIQTSFQAQQYKACNCVRSRVFRTPERDLYERSLTVIISLRTNNVCCIIILRLLETTWTIQSILNEIRKKWSETEKARKRFDFVCNLGRLASSMDGNSTNTLYRAVRILNLLND